MTDFKHLKIDEVGDVTVVQFRGHALHTAAEVYDLGQELRHVVVGEQRKKLVVIDFTSVAFLPSEVLGKLISANHKLAGHGGALRLCNLAPEIQEIFQISRLDHIFDIRHDVEDALASL